MSFAIVFVIRHIYILNKTYTCIRVIMQNIQLCIYNFQYM